MLTLVSAELARRELELARRSGWKLFTFPCGALTSSESFFAAARAVLPLSPPVLGCERWDALSDSMWEAVYLQPQRGVLLIFPESGFGDNATHEQAIMLDVLEELVDSLARPEFTDGIPRRVVGLLGTCDDAQRQWRRIVADWDTSALGADLHALCHALLPKVPCALDAIQYERVGEWGLALEMLSDWCVDAEPPILLSAEEIRRFIAIGERLSLRAPWADLLPLVDPRELESLPSACAAMARDFLAGEISDAPERRAWLLKVEAAVSGIESASLSEQ